MQIRQTFYNSIGYPSLLILANFAGIAVMYGSVVIFQQWSPWWWNTVTPLRIPICGIVHAVTVIATMCLLAKCVIKEVQRYLVRSGSSRSVQIGYLASFCKIMSLAAPSALSHLMDFGFRIDLLYLSGIFNVNGSILGEAFRMPLLARAFSRFVSAPSMTAMSRLVGGFFSTDNIQQAERAGAMAISSSVVLTLLAYKLAASQGIYFDNGELDNYDASFSLLIGMTIAACVVSFMSESVLVGIGKQRVVLLANMCGFVAFALLWYMCAMFQNGQFSAASAWSVVALSAAITTISQLNWLWGSQWQSN
ncbi:hypothetical protein GQ42DRAFT_156120 [Ramicandelaber brevisporus]|nr:hypothetical protein GQ42DRAFT_156120 [Ramicandelaber brevisporus]